MAEDERFDRRRFFREGLRETVEWYVENRAWWEPLKERARLPAG